MTVAPSGKTMTVVDNDKLTSRHLHLHSHEAEVAAIAEVMPNSPPAFIAADAGGAGPALHGRVGRRFGVSGVCKRVM